MMEQPLDPTQREGNPFVQDFINSWLVPQGTWDSRVSFEGALQWLASLQPSDLGAIVAGLASTWWTLSLFATMVAFVVGLVHGRSFRLAGQMLHAAGRAVVVPPALAWIAMAAPMRFLALLATGRSSGNVLDVGITVPAPQQVSPKDLKPYFNEQHRRLQAVFKWLSAAPDGGGAVIRMDGDKAIIVPMSEPGMGPKSVWFDLLREGVSSLEAAGLSHEERRLRVETGLAAPAIEEASPNGLIKVGGKWFACLRPKSAPQFDALHPPGLLKAWKTVDADVRAVAAFRPLSAAGTHFRLEQAEKRRAAAGSRPMVAERIARGFAALAAGEPLVNAEIAFFAAGDTPEEAEATAVKVTMVAWAEGVELVRESEYAGELWIQAPGRRLGFTMALPLATLLGLGLFGPALGQEALEGTDFPWMPELAFPEQVAGIPIPAFVFSLFVGILLVSVAGDLIGISGVVLGLAAALAANAWFWKLTRDDPWWMERARRRWFPGKTERAAPPGAPAE